MHGGSHDSTWRSVVRPEPFVENAFFFVPLYGFGFLHKNEVFIGAWLYIWDFDLILSSDCLLYANVMWFLLLLLCSAA